MEGRQKVAVCTRAQACMHIHMRTNTNTQLRPGFYKILVLNFGLWPTSLGVD